MFTDRRSARLPGIALSASLAVRERVDPNDVSSHYVPQLLPGPFAPVSLPAGSIEYGLGCAFQRAQPYRPHNVCHIHQRESSGSRITSFGACISERAGSELHAT